MSKGREKRGAWRQITKQQEQDHLEGKGRSFGARQAKQEKQKKAADRRQRFLAKKQLHSRALSSSTGGTDFAEYDPIQAQAIESKAGAHHQSGLATLPAELWSYIGHFLSRSDILSLASVCHEWRVYALAQHVSHSIDSSKYNNPDMILQQFQFISSDCVGLRSLDLSKCYGVSASEFRDLKPFHLRSLNLTGCFNVTDEVIELLPRTLHDLSLQECTRLTDAAMKHLPPELISLNLAKCFEISSEGLSHLPSSIESLNLCECWNACESLSHLPPQLRKLEMFCSTKDSDLEILPSTIQSLSLRSCNYLTDEGLSLLSPRTRLVDLDLSECNKITDDGLQFLPTTLESLRLVRCSRIWGSGLECLRPMTNLRSLNLSQSLAGHMSEHMRDLPEGLEELDVSMTSVNDEALVGLPKGLKRLNLSFCKMITDAGLKGLPKGLLELKLKENFKNVTDAGLKELPQGLKVLDLSGCDQVTEEGILSVPKGLRTLIVTYRVEDLTKSGIRKIQLRVNPQLEVIDVPSHSLL